MKDYRTPNIEICWISSNDIMTGSFIGEIIEALDPTAKNYGYEDGGNLNDIFKIG